jgi:hypothetical protein
VLDDDDVVLEDEVGSVVLVVDDLVVVGPGASGEKERRREDSRYSRARGRGGVGQRFGGEVPGGPPWLWLPVPAVPPGPPGAGSSVGGGGCFWSLGSAPPGCRRWQ